MKYRGNQLSALLSNWDTYEKMLSEYNSDEAVGSAMREAEKTAQSFEGRLNTLSNSWTDLVNNLTGGSGVLTGFVNVLIGVTDTVNSLMKSFGNLSVIIPTVFAAMSFKNVGEHLNTPVYAQPHLICA